MKYIVIIPNHIRCPKDSYIANSSNGFKVFHDKQLAEDYCKLYWLQGTAVIFELSE